MTGDAHLFGQSDREGQFGRTAVIDIAAEGVVRIAVARADAAAFKAAEVVAAEHVAFVDTHAVIAESVDRSDFSEQVEDDFLLIDRDEVAATDIAGDEFCVAAEASAVRK